MIKRSAILLMILAVSSFSLLIFTSYGSSTSSPDMPESKVPVKCSGGCNKKSKVPVQWNIVSPAMFQTES